MAILIGAILTLATSPIYTMLQKKFNIACKKGLISSILTLILFLFVFLPLIYFISSSYQFIPKINVDASQQYLQNVVSYLKNLPEPFNIFQEPINALLSEFNIYNVNMDIVKSILNNLADFFWKINGIIYQFFLILFFYFLFNYYSSHIFILITRLLPMAKRFKRTLYDELSNTISSVFFGTIFSMIMQGIAFGLFLYFTTDYDAVYLGVATGFLTAIPIVGTYLIAVPIAVIELLNQNFLFSFVILLFAVIVLSGFIDNVLRLLFMKYLNRKFSLNYSLSEFFILLSMLAGISVFGGWGIIIAPALLSLSVTLIHIYLKNNKNTSM
jgi:predicted PurR-regulated permease PerM